MGIRLKRMYRPYRRFFMKKIINKPDNVVDEMVHGIAKASPEKLQILEDSTIVARKNFTDGKVGLISGGGSGHEPSHAGYVGEGMLDCAVCGEVFTSPTPDQVLKAIEASNTGAGVFMVVKNYTGDVMNFEMAKDMAEMNDIKVDYIVVNDDVAVEDSLYTAGRRGVAGTVFFHKILGAMAEEGKSLDEMKEKAEHLKASVRSMGMAIKPCVNPTSGEASFELGDKEMEIGIGIHGEPGIRREELKPANDIAQELIDTVLKEYDEKDGEFALMVNGMGQTPEMELFIVNNFLKDYLKDKVNVTKTYVGNFMTSLDMAGFSVTLLKMDETDKKYLEAKADTLKVVR